ncbi:OmpA family protein [Alisedimentitalea sp. MJ-SS2]|uniref:OmpA family protein n=1 Tax=Aliisedimentitalea sp. MJ-SS2 TaxID=3049795 RepID=UPI00290F5AD1|nr:OmpA family protein [Alisedimentitalea sp. MJ-SS2]MDU8926091.1 OmpA family protein [Alisedimentitalea sp. MJ-SS2]
MKKILLLSTGLLALTGCAVNTPGGQSFFREAGANIDTGHFGNATMNNTQIMSGERSFVFSLASRFAQEVPTNVNFAFDSAVLDAGARDTLRQQARWIRQFPEVRFKVFGHADAPGSNAYNKRLGLRRAKAVVRYLASQGISRSRLEAVSSLGETQLIVNTQGRDRRNRRAVTEVSGFVRSHPSVLDGKYAAIIYRDYVESAQSRTTLEGITGDDLKTSE